MVSKLRKRCSTRVLEILKHARKYIKRTTRATCATLVREGARVLKSAPIAQLILTARERAQRRVR
eukprot:7803134-Alexandrium_andersonii.AAC.1